VTGKTGSLSSIVLPSSISGDAFNADNAMTGFNGATLNYDDNGNLTSDGTNAYTWDARNHLTAISGGSTASFVYDAFGRRAQKTINGTSTQFLYDGSNSVQEIQGGSPSANLLAGLGIDERFQRTDSTGVRSFLTDNLGTTLALVDSAGTIQTNYTYQPFGSATASGETNANAYQFTGRENDLTGLYYYRARYYSPAFQRFITQDPIGFAGGDANIYAYVGNDSPNFRDLSGWQVYPSTPGAPPPKIPYGPPTLKPYPPGEPGMYCLLPTASPTPLPEEPDPSEAGNAVACVLGIIVCPVDGPAAPVCAILDLVDCASLLSPGPGQPSLPPSSPHVEPPEPGETNPAPD